MVSVAKNKSILKKRLLRFFLESKERKELEFFLNSTSEKNEILVFGGLVRDIALFGISGFDSDIDLVFTGPPSELERLINSTFKENKFGGYRGRIGSWPVDIWSLEKTWAFKKGLIPLKSNESLLDTTFTNWDSIYFEWRNRKIICPEFYFQELQEGYLNLNLKENPNDIGCTVRVIRYFISKHVSAFSPTMVEYMREQLEKFSNRQLIHAEGISYPNKKYLNNVVINYIRKSVNEHPLKSPLKLLTINKTGDLF